MTTTLMAYFPSPPRGVWYLGPLPIRAYALCIIAGIVAALIIGDRRWEARGGERGVIYDVAIWAVPFGLIGGRLYHVITDWQKYFGAGGAGPIGVLRIWDGGLGIWGAVALGGLGGWIGCRRRGIPLPAFGDAIAPGIVLAQAIGRIGNYFNQELYGRETTLPWGMEVFYRQGPSGYIDVNSLDGVSTGQLARVVQPTFLYELLWDLLLFVVLLYLDRRFRVGHGRLFALYVAGYCVGRFYIELLRDDLATHIAGIRINSFTATFVFIGAVVYMILAPRGREDPATLGGTHAESEEPSEPEQAAELVTVASEAGVVATAPAAEPVTDEGVAPDGGATADSGRTAAVQTSVAADVDVGDADPGDKSAEAGKSVAGEADGAELEKAADDAESVAGEGDAEVQEVDVVEVVEPEVEATEGSDEAQSQTAESDLGTVDQTADVTPAGEPGEDAEPKPDVTEDAESVVEEDDATEVEEVAEDTGSEPEVTEDVESVSGEGDAEVQEVDVVEVGEPEVEATEGSDEAQSQTAESDLQTVDQTADVTPAGEPGEDAESEPEVTEDAASVAGEDDATEVEEAVDDAESESEPEVTEDAASVAGEDDAEAQEADVTEDAESVAGEDDVPESRTDIVDETEAAIETAASSDPVGEAQAAPANERREGRRRWWSRTKRER